MASHDDVAERDTDAAVMTEALVLQQCKMQMGYSTPELNEKLYLHHRGFARLGGLAAFTGCVVLYLDNNALSDLAGLAPLTRLDSLYLSRNALARLDSLPRLPVLRTLDVAQNCVTSLEGLDAAAPLLQTLLAGGNRLQGLDGVRGLSCLMSLDASHNRIADEEKTRACLRGHSATLRTLMLHGNELCRCTPHHRKRWIAAIPALRFLDESPVFEDERERAEAFVAGGAAAEAAIRVAQRERAAAESQRQFDFFSAAREAQRDARRRSGAETRPTAYFLAHAAPAAPPRGARGVADVVDADGSDGDNDDDAPPYIPVAHRDPMHA
ncbi:hypothetical protein NESM_000113000 [Novymonas esmeraldas]|uniref:Uncharacterized protein n=1 Tax=Novymonas esmeraldas TaxID=1808958 RepID=A0AAW0F4K0_9TRYP